MAKSSINFQKASGHSSDHNFRKDKPNYLLPKEFQLKNEFWQHEKSEQEIFNDELSRAKRKGGRKPKLENSRWEAVLNLNKNHSLEDVKKVAKHIEEKFNITCSEIAIHRDEGFVENNKPSYNFHAHINFVTYKDGRQNWRKEHIKPSTLSELQTEVAELLKMERGQINSKAERLSHKQYKAVAKELAKQKDLKEEIKELRAELKQRASTRADYAQLEQLNKELKTQIKAKDLTLEELRTQIETYKNELRAEQEHNDLLKSTNMLLEKQIDSKTQENSDLKALLKEKEEQLEDSKIEIQELKEDKEYADNEIVEIAKELNAEPFSYSIKEAVKSLYGKIKSLTKELLASKKLINALNLKNKALEEENIVLKEKIVSRANMSVLTTKEEIEKWWDEIMQNNDTEEQEQEQTRTTRRLK